MQQSAYLSVNNYQHKRKLYFFFLELAGAGSKLQVTVRALQYYYRQEESGCTVDNYCSSSHQFSSKIDDSISSENIFQLFYC